MLHATNSLPVGEHRTLRHQALFKEAPQRDRQFARNRNDHDPSDTPALPGSSLHKPAGDRTLWLVLEPEPSRLDYGPAHLASPGSRDPLGSLHVSAHRIADKRILRLIAKWLKVGIIEDGRVTRSQVGAPQGAVISPILANAYLHYAYDLWVQRWRQTIATGDMIVVRFADDQIVGFEHEHEAKAFLHDLHERMRAFELALHPDKTRLIRFGRHAAEQRARLGEGKPETFDFLGFTHFCTRSRKWGSFVIGRKTIKKRMRAKLKAIKVELRKSMHDPIAKTGAWVKQMLQGHLNYYAVSGNHPSLWWFCNQVRWLWLKSLRRRSQKARPLLGALHPPRRPLLSANQGADTPLPLSPLRRQNPREEPGALAALAGI